MAAITATHGARTWPKSTVNTTTAAGGTSKSPMAKKDTVWLTIARQPLLGRLGEDVGPLSGEAKRCEDGDHIAYRELTTDGSDRQGNDQPDPCPLAGEDGKSECEHRRLHDQSTCDRQILPEKDLMWLRRQDEQIAGGVALPPEQIEGDRKTDEEDEDRGDQWGPGTISEVEEAIGIHDRTAHGEADENDSPRPDQPLPGIPHVEPQLLAGHGGHHPPRTDRHATTTSTSCRFALLNGGRQEPSEQAAPGDGEDDETD